MKRDIRIEGDTFKIKGQAWWEPNTEITEYVELVEYDGECPDLSCLSEEKDEPPPL